MLEPDAIQRMFALHRLGWGSKRIAGELVVARNAVKRYLAAGGYVPYQSPARPGKLAALRDMAIRVAVTAGVFSIWRPCSRMTLK